jgi:outer membrane protein TolC
VGALLGVSVGSLCADDATELGQDPQTGVDSYFHASDSQLEELITALLEDNPEIRSAHARSRSQSERVPQAQSLPDPQLDYRYFAREPETRVGPQEMALEISQAVPWKGKRGLQAERARSLALSAAWQAQDLERILVAELKRAYFRAAYLQEALTINAEERDLLRRFESIALKRYSTGVGIQQSVVRVQTDITRLYDQETALRERLDALIRRIAELIGRPDSELTLSTIALGIVRVDYDRTELEQAAVTRHPKVLALEQRIESDRAWSRRRALESRPDFRFGLGYTVVGDREELAGMLLPPEENGQDIVALTVGINLPIHRARVRAGIAEAEEIRRSNEELLMTSQNRLRYLVQEAVLRLESLEERSRLYDEVLIPQAEESLASSEAAYTTGRQDLLDLLDAERVLFQVRLTYHGLVSDYWIAVSDLEFGIGDRFPRGSMLTGSSNTGRGRPEETP